MRVKGLPAEIVAGLEDLRGDRVARWDPKAPGGPDDLREEFLAVMGHALPMSPADLDENDAPIEVRESSPTRGLEPDEAVSLEEAEEFVERYGFVVISGEEQEMREPDRIAPEIKMLAQLYAETGDPRVRPRLEALLKKMDTPREGV
ncbi:MAG: hypothetical protein LBR22_00750 [Desulfovibrio sp.]|nr:hypothetical protein [Desulfovibrio sp.]